MPCKEILENRKKSVPVADILRHAANNELQKPRGNTKTEFSCLAVTNTIRKLLRPDVYWFEDVKRCKQG